MSTLERARQGDGAAFAELLEPLRGKVFAVACRIVGPDDAEDVVMDTFLKTWQALPKFRGGSSLSTWVLHIARNRALDLLRARRAKPLVQMDSVAQESFWNRIEDRTQPGPDELAASRETAEAVDRALEAIPGEHRISLQLRYVDGLRYSEIAAATGVTIGTVMSRIFYGKAKLRALLRAGYRPDKLPEGEQNENG
ncbi:MAG: sigma-70 family RNA polymerase sigma factor [Kiritimatiellia bacterium]|nr:sigma-70 family RNA polymerase sigma factor [Kiritimatiellia bacterium]